MSRLPADPAVPDPPVLVEGVAHVVAVEENLIWLEPESSGACGGCSAAGRCGTGDPSVFRRRRFTLPGDLGLAVGDRVVVGMSERALLRAALTAYALPLAVMLVAGALAQALAGRDDVTLLAMAAALGIGLLGARRRARVLGARGQLTPRFLRRADSGERCRAA